MIPTGMPEQCTRQARVLIGKMFSMIRVSLRANSPDSVPFMHDILKVMIKTTTDEIPIFIGIFLNKDRKENRKRSKTRNS
jgi:hypothetical protein